MLLRSVFDRFENIITIEDGCIKGGFGDAVLDYAQTSSYKGRIHKLGIPDKFIEQGDTKELYELAGISSEKIKSKIKAVLNF
jgi:1-deoxy-D-xylulose-5-phosphate synthase